MSRCTATIASRALVSGSRQARRALAARVWPICPKHFCATSSRPVFTHIFDMLSQTPADCTPLTLRYASSVLPQATWYEKSSSAAVVSASTCSSPAKSRSTVRVMAVPVLSWSTVPPMSGAWAPAPPRSPSWRAKYTCGTTSATGILGAPPASASTHEIESCNKMRSEPATKSVMTQCVGSSCPGPSIMVVPFRSAAPAVGEGAGEVGLELGSSPSYASAWGTTSHASRRGSPASQVCATGTRLRPTEYARKVSESRSYTKSRESGTRSVPFPPCAAPASRWSTNKDTRVPSLLIFTERISPKGFSPSPSNFRGVPTAFSFDRDTFHTRISLREVAATRKAPFTSRPTGTPSTSGEKRMTRCTEPWRLVNSILSPIAMAIWRSTLPWAMSTAAWIGAASRLNELCTGTPKGVISCTVTCLLFHSITKSPPMLSPRTRKPGVSTWRVFLSKW
mmetsp:Transcript_57731/g.175851  ORF Transcript_57731/g.175851 Transcript_57731/m.175851 type:complete len:451 (-) Transcript_57731:1105-2457(-)